MAEKEILTVPHILEPNNHFAFMQWAVFTASFVVACGVVLVRSAFVED